MNIPINVTSHAAKRMAQRAIRIDDLQLAIRIGTEVEGGFIVLKKDAELAVRDLKHQIIQIERLIGKRLVMDGSAIVTAYHAGNKKERRLLQEKRSHHNSAMPQNFGRWQS
jgi:hypothetical protein